MANHTLFGGGGFREYGPKRIQGTSYGMCVGLGSGGWYTDGIERPFLFTCPFHGKLFIELPARQMDSFHPLHGNGSLILVEIVSNAQHKSNWVA